MVLVTLVVLVNNNWWYWGYWSTIGVVGDVGIGVVGAVGGLCDDLCLGLCGVLGVGVGSCG